MIVGGNGGIGLAMVKRLLNVYSYDFVFATYRGRQPELSDPRLTWVQMDASCERSVKKAMGEAQSLDWVINAVGFLHSDTQHPEKNILQVDSTLFHETMRANTLPTLLLAKYAFPLLQKSSQPKFAALSARIGSISDNQLGGWYSYRASKAALNMIIKTMSIEWQRTLINATVLALHPGTTDTQLSAPFQRNVPEGKLFSPERVAHDLVDVLERATPCQTGLLLAYDGTTISW